MGLNKSTGIAVQTTDAFSRWYQQNNQQVFFRNPLANSTKGGGLYIEFPYCLPLNTFYVLSLVRGLGVSNASFLNKLNIFEQNFDMNDDDGPVFILPHK